MIHDTTIDSVSEITVEVPETKTRLVIIHDTDADGICAAWCIARGFSNEYSETLLIPQRAGDNIIPEGLTEDDEVFLVDRSYSWSTLLVLSQQVFAVTVIDHHKSAMEKFINDTKGFVVDAHTFSSTEQSLHLQYDNLVIHIDTTHSTCALAYQYTLEHGIDSDTTISIPWFVSYIEDRDLWKWQLPNSKEINAGMYHAGHTFEQYDKWYQYCGPSFQYNKLLDVESNFAIGSIVVQTQLKIIKNIAHGPTVKYELHTDTCWTTSMLPKRVPENDVTTLFAIVCCPFSLISDLGDYMLNYKSDDPADTFRVPDAVLCYNKVAEGYVYSIRSKRDILWLAERHSGGGHPNACGFKTLIPPEDVLTSFPNRYCDSYSIQ